MTFFVNVPNVAGVPSVALAAGFIANTVLLTEDAPDLFQGYGGASWGVFLNGGMVVTADTVASVEYRQEWIISDYPVEEGAFESYDKVARPFEARVRFAAGGSEGNRQALLDSIAAIAGDYNLYDVVTPEAVYSNANVAHYDYRRMSTNGVGLLVVDVWLQQIQVTTMQTSSTSDTSSSGSTDSSSGSSTDSSGSGSSSSGGGGTASAGSATGSADTQGGPGFSPSAASGADQVVGGTVQPGAANTTQVNTIVSQGGIGMQ